MKRPTLTSGIWVVAITSLIVAGLVAGLFITMAAALDPADLLTAGTEPWIDAMIAALAFACQIAVTVLCLRLWHGTRFKAVGLVLTAIDAGIVCWTCIVFYNDYF